MSDWAFLNKHRTSVPGYPDTDETWGFNGAFKFWIHGTKVKAVASDGGGWRHVSVSLYDYPTATPRWEVMCAIKDLFWDAEDCVIQFHPPKSNYVNCHPGCLHLWQVIDGREQPQPEWWMVGPKKDISPPAVSQPSPATVMHTSPDGPAAGVE